MIVVQPNWSKLSLGDGREPMRYPIALIAYIVTATVCSDVAFAKEITSFTQDAWEGGAYSDDNTGAFSHCAASAGYNSGLGLIVSVGRDYNWEIAIVNPGWKLAPRSQHSLAFRIDGGPWLDSPGTASGQTVIEIPMSGDSTLITLFRRGHILQVAGEGFKSAFDLSGTSRLMATLAGCVQDSLTAESPPNATSVPATVASSAVAAASNSSGADAKLITGTGIVISKDGDILTNNHVIKDCTSIVVRVDNVPARSASVLYTDDTNDLALLKIDGSFTARAIALFHVSPSVRAGDETAVYGYPLAGTLSVSGNIVQGNVSALSGLGDDARYFQITAPIQPGNSGGPLLDMAGNVTGVVNSKLDEMKMASISGDIPQNVNFAIKGNVATNFLDAHSIPYEVAANAADLDSLASVADKARPFTALIVCQ